MSRVLTLAEGMLAGLVALTGAVLAVSWMLGKRYRASGLHQPPPAEGVMPAWQHHQSPPGR